MRVLHVVKTADGADWAATQAAELVKLGIEVHVALPSAQGRTVDKWVGAGVVVHTGPTDLPIRSPWSLRATMRRIRDLVSNVRPDLIHSHFFGSTVLLRLALGANHRIPRLFQVPGPLHLEHRFWRMLEMSTAGSCDSWIASSRCILAHYQSAGISEERLYLSYYGIPAAACQDARVGFLRKRYGIGDHMKIVGNANFMYPPKWYLGQRIGLKAHEDVIDALGLVTKQRSDVLGVLIGGTAPESAWYERRLRDRARAAGGDGILMTGYLPTEEIRQMWPDFDAAVHVPISENCGGVVEPMLAGVPTIASTVGGLPEVVIDGVTGKCVAPRRPRELAGAILEVLNDSNKWRRIAAVGSRLARQMFDATRTGPEIAAVYECVLYGKRRPIVFDSMDAASQTMAECGT